MPRCRWRGPAASRPPMTAPTVRRRTIPPSTCHPVAPPPCHPVAPPPRWRGHPAGIRTRRRPRRRDSVRRVHPDDGAKWFPALERQKVDYRAGQVQGHTLERLFPRYRPGTSGARTGRPEHRRVGGPGRRQCYPDGEPGRSRYGARPVGGTGKTSVAVNLARVFDKPLQLLDCDVEEPNAHLLNGTTTEETQCRSSEIILMPKMP